MRKNKFALYLTYGDREDLTFKDTIDLADQGILPHNKNEILRRGLHCCRFLAEVDDKRVVQEFFSWYEALLQKNSFTRDFLEGNLGPLIDHRNLTIAVFVARFGIEAYDAYANVFNRIKLVEDEIALFLKKTSLPEEFELPKEIVEEITKLVAAGDALFRGK